MFNPRERSMCSYICFCAFLCCRAHPPPSLFPSFTGLSWRWLFSAELSHQSKAQMHKLHIWCTWFSPLAKSYGSPSKSVFQCLIWPVWFPNYILLENDLEQKIVVLLISETHSCRWFIIYFHFKNNTGVAKQFTSSKIKEKKWFSAHICLVCLRYSLIREDTQR